MPRRREMGSMAKRYRSLPLHDRDVRRIHNKLNYLEQEKERSLSRGRRYLPLSLMGPISASPGIYNALALVAAKQQSQVKQVSPQQQAQSAPSSTMAPGTLNATTSEEVKQEIIPDTKTSPKILSTFKDLFSFFAIYF